MTDAKGQTPTIPLPSRWNDTVRSAVLHVVSLAQFAVAQTRGWAADSPNARIRLKAQNGRLEQEVELLREEIRIKDARLEQIPASRRPHYPPIQRMAILELKAARSWSLEQAARAFLVTAATIASWLKRIDEKGAAALVQLPQPPVNKLPQYVSHVVRRLKTLCPAMGKVKIAQTLARAGLHLGATTVGRMLKGGEDVAHLTSSADPLPDAGDTVGPSCREGPSEKEATADVSGTLRVPLLPDGTRSVPDTKASKPRVVTAKRPNHLWHADLTLVSTALGFWTSWMPFALPQCWPFCWWVAGAVDHFSRRVMGFAVFKSQPTSAEVRAFLGRTARTAGTAPKHLVVDKGVQFWNPGFKAWCKRKGIQPRFGAIGQNKKSFSWHGFFVFSQRWGAYCPRRPRGGPKWPKVADRWPKCSRDGTHGWRIV
jgi:transposase